jgi:AraC-like DNA-binding protein
MDGTEMCSILKSDIRTSHIPVIMLTGKVTTEERIQGLETGADDYITKPFEMQEVAVRVKNLVSQRKKLRKKYSHMISFDFNDEDVTSLDQKFLNSVVDVIDREMCNDKFEVGCLCKELNISHSTLFRKIHALTGLSPVEFIRNRRLQRAAYLLKQQYGNVSQVAMEVGFSNPSYFTKMFKKAYSISPSEFTKT